MWALYLVAFVIFTIGWDLFLEERQSKVDADDIGRISKGDHHFAGLVLMLVGVSIAIWV
ncbi:hypothetical protein D3C81_379150 [compost metagenome]